MIKKKKNKWIPKLEDNYINIDTHSWFDIIEYHKNSNYHSSIISSSDKILTRAKQIKLFPNFHQVDILQKWFDLSWRMFPNV